MTCAKQVLISKLIDEIVWSPTDDEIRAIYAKDRWERMLIFYKDFRENRHKMIMELQAQP